MKHVYDNFDFILLNLKMKLDHKIFKANDNTRV